MTTPTRRRSNPLAEMLHWFDTDNGRNFRPFEPSFIKIEDYVEEGTYVLRAEMPGIDPEKDVDITVDSGMLTIRAERREEEKDRDHHEFHYGSFTRSIPLPAGHDPDEVSASYIDGVLELRVPVEESTSEPRRITVQRAES